MAGVKEQRDVGAFRGATEGGKRVQESVAVEVEPRNDIEAHGLEARDHVAGVIARIGEPRDVRVTRIADHQRDPALGQRRLRDRQREPQNGSRAANY